MRAPAKGSSQVSPTWSGTSEPASSSRCRAIGEKTAPGISPTLGAQRGGRGTRLPSLVPSRASGAREPRARVPRAGPASGLLGEDRGVALAEGRVQELVAGCKQPLVLAALAPAPLGVGGLVGRPGARRRRAEDAGQPAVER